MGASQSNEGDHQPHATNIQATPVSVETRANGYPQSHETKAKAVEETKETKPKLPHNCEAILKDADSHVDRSSAEKLYEQLCDGVLLNRAQKKYWIDKKSNGNCFMLYASDLLITWADNDHYWRWISLNETTSAMNAVKLVNVCWLEVHGRFDITKLSPGILYEIVFVVKLDDPAYGWKVPVSLRMVLPNGNKKERKENFMKLTRGEWIEISVGDLQTSPSDSGEMEFTLYEYEGGEWKRGLTIKGVAIRPKNYVGTVS